MQGCRIPALNAFKEMLIFIKPAKVFQKAVIHALPIQHFRLISNQEMPEMGLKVKGCIEIGVYLVGWQLQLHPLEELLDLISTLFQEDIKEFPGPGVQIPDIHTTEFEVMEPAFVKWMQLLMVTKKFLS